MSSQLKEKSLKDDSLLSVTKCKTQKKETAKTDGKHSHCNFPKLLIEIAFNQMDWKVCGPCCTSHTGREES